jgi:Resolvase, N terminal domain
MRVSTADQHPENQRPVLEQLVATRGVTIVREFVVHASASARGEKFERQRAELVAGAERGDYDTVFIWAIDRLSRLGIRDSLGTLASLGAVATVVSSQDGEPRTSTASSRRPSRRGLRSRSQKTQRRACAGGQGKAGGRWPLWHRRAPAVRLEDRRHRHRGRGGMGSQMLPGNHGRPVSPVPGCGHPGCWGSDQQRHADDARHAAECPAAARERTD